jgi:hypothetical protein
MDTRIIKKYLVYKARNGHYNPDDTKYIKGVGDVATGHVSWLRSNGYLTSTGTVKRESNLSKQMEEVSRIDDNFKRTPNEIIGFIRYQSWDYDKKTRYDNVLGYVKQYEESRPDKALDASEVDDAYDKMKQHFITNNSSYVDEVFKENTGN